MLAGMNRRSLGLGLVFLLLLVAVVAGRAWRARDAPMTSQASSPAPAVRIPAPPAPPSPLPPTPVDPSHPLAPPPGPAVRLDALLAPALDRLHVRCFVGEEYSGLRRVEDGWFSMVTDRWEGRQSISDDTLTTQRVVYWSAAEGASQTTCRVLPDAWAELTVHAVEEDGGPAAGVAVVGCGVLEETGADGIVTAPVLVLPMPCTVQLERYDEGIVSTAFVRLAPFEEHEQRRITASLMDYDLSDEPTSRYDHDAIEEMPVGEVRHLEPMLPRTPREELAHRQEALDLTQRWVDALSDALARTPEEDRWLVEERLAASEERVADWVAAVEEQEARMAAE